MQSNLSLEQRTEFVDLLDSKSLFFFTNTNIFYLKKYFLLVQINFSWKFILSTNLSVNVTVHAQNLIDHNLSQF